jgi:histidinol-phosphatase (PHP family)
MQNFDLHMHTTYCDGKDSAEAMVLSAIENGLSFAGISGHSFTPHDQCYCMTREGTQRYIEEIRALREKYADRITLLLGTELDRYADIDLSPYDYWLGSVHYIFSEEGKRKYAEILASHGSGAADAELEALVKYEDWCPVDDAPEDLQRFAENYDGLMDVAEMYFETVGGIVSATDCDIIGHFDLITKFNEPVEIYDTSDPRYIAAWKKAIDRIFDDCAERYKNGYRNRLEKPGVLKAGDKPVFEINTGAISKGYRTLPYPAADQIDYIKSKGGVLILNSDSHAAGTVCYGFEEFENLVD